jgi:hypothetical protein
MNRETRENSGLVGDICFNDEAVHSELKAAFYTPLRP